MKITVFTSCYNQSEFLTQAIASVCLQTHSDIEYLLYDDGSTDDTWSVIQSHGNSYIKSFKLDKQPNVGVIINRSFQDMTGDAWVWCPADDVLYPNCLQDKYEFSKSHSGAVIYSDWDKLDEKGRCIGQTRLPPTSPEQFSKDIWSSCNIGFTGIYIPHSVIGKVPPFPEDMDCSEDYFWTLKATEIGVPFVHLPIITHGKRYHANRTTVRHKIDRAAVAELVRSS